MNKDFAGTPPYATELFSSPTNGSNLRAMDDSQSLFIMEKLRLGFKYLSLLFQYHGKQAEIQNKSSACSIHGQRDFRIAWDERDRKLDPHEN